MTHHSRANCAGFNESVSWDGRAINPKYQFNAGVISQHFPREPDGSILWDNWHVVETGAQFAKWRVGALHAFVPSIPGHAVVGHHWLQGAYGAARKTTTTAVGCNITQGWINWVNWGPTQ